MKVIPGAAGRQPQQQGDVRVVQRRPPLTQPPPQQGLNAQGVDEFWLQAFDQLWRYNGGFLNTGATAALLGDGIR